MILKAKFEELDSKFNPRFDEMESIFMPDFGEKIVIETTTEHEFYDGSYEVTPAVESQTLPTKKKLMADDLTIKEIPIYETTNNSGGTTVYIAKE